ncbi:MAG: hypothetical protein ACFB10_07525 [Salibacteraceae bacterium]
MIRALLFILLLSCFQAPTQASTSLDATIVTFYQLLSGPAGPRDWEKLRGYCAADAQFNAVTYAEDGSPSPLIGTIDNYINNAGPFFEKNGFEIREIKRKTQIYGNIAQIFSTYQASYTLAGNAEKFEERGVYSFQLIRTSSGWQFLHVFWNVESPFDPLPEEHLPPKSNSAPAVVPKTKASTPPTQPTQKAAPGAYLYKPGEIDLPPRYPGGEAALKNDLKKHLKPSGESYFRRPDGSTWINVQFIVNQEGKVEQFQVVGATEPLSLSQLKALSTLPDWQPCRLNGQPVRVMFNLSIPFNP